VIGSAQAACLGMKDIRSPLLVMVAAAFINLLGDVVLVRNAHPWLGGAAGAAWATVLSQYAAMFMFIKWLNMKKPSDGTEKGSMHTDAISKESTSTQGILHKQLKFIELLKIPQYKHIAQKFKQYIVPVTTTSIGRVSGYIAMSHVVSSAFGTVDMAAQQIVLAFFLCFVPMADSLNLTAQSFVPGIYDSSSDGERKGVAGVDATRIRSKVMKDTVKHFIQAGGIFGLALAAVVSCMPLVSRFFTRDPAVIASVNLTTPYLALYCALAGVVCAGEGILLGRKDLKYLSQSFMAFFFVVPYFLLRLKTAVLNGAKDIGLDAVWRVFTVYQVIRCGMWLLRLRQLSIRDEKDLLPSE